jgi:hypothetical protein
MEKIKNIIENSLGSSKRFENPKDELMYDQFTYFEKIDNGVLVPLKYMISELKHIKEENKEGYFVEFLCRYSNLRKEALSRYEEKKKLEENYDIKIFDEWFNNICNEIGNDYKSGDKRWKDHIKDIFDSNLKKLIPEEKKISDDLNIENKKNIFGLINANLIFSDNLEKFGIGKNDECLSIHFKELSKQKNKDRSIQNIFSSGSLSKLAVSIVEEHPQVKAIIAKSWLVDSPIGRRIGFKVFRKYKSIMEGMGFWGQFIKEDGNIDQKRMQEFLETGVPKYLPSEGFIKTEDFLKKYLPLEKRGLIELKELTEESIKDLNSFEELKNNLNKNWKEISKEELSLLLMNSHVIVNYVKTEKGKIWFSLMMRAKELGTTPSKLDNFSKDIEKDFVDYIENLKKYKISKKIDI